MTIRHIRIQNLRCFSNLSVELSATFNCLIAENGVGKTSFLEAIYLLSCGHSFRSREIASLIRYQQSDLTVFASHFNNDTVSIQKSLNKSTKIKVNAEPCARTSDLAYLLPCQIYYQDLFSIMDGSAALRRKILDWGMFHVEHSYHTRLKKYNQLLKQRNALLKQRKEKRHFEPWDRQLAEYGNALHTLRLKYSTELSLAMQNTLAQLSEVQCDLIYYKGWDKRQQGTSLFDQLQNDYEKDCLKGYTSVGAHQADLDLKTAQGPAKEMLSRGQKKIALIALKIAQTELLRKPSIHLMDDVFSELDKTHIERLLNKIQSLEGQRVLTLLREDWKYLKNHKVDTKIYL